MTERILIALARVNPLQAVELALQVGEIGPFLRALEREHLWIVRPNQESDWTIWDTSEAEERVHQDLPIDIYGLQIDGFPGKKPWKFVQVYSGHRIDILCHLLGLWNLNYTWEHAPELSGVSYQTIRSKEIKGAWTHLPLGAIDALLEAEPEPLPLFGGIK